VYRIPTNLTDRLYLLPNNVATSASFFGLNVGVLVTPLPLHNYIPEQPTQGLIIMSPPIIHQNLAWVVNSSSTSFSTTFTSSLQSVSTTSSTSPPLQSSTSSSTLSHTSSSTSFTPASPTSNVNAQALSVCLGHGIDTSSTGLIATVVLPSAIGLLLWVRIPHHFNL